ncbi:MAG: YitT family protein [Lachnospiraceae bacterium]
MNEKIHKRLSARRIGCMILGIVIIGLGVACLRLASFGTDPFSCMNIGVSNHLPISYGTYQAIVNIVLFIPVILINPKSFGLGALFNMLGLGYVVDGWMWIFQKSGITVEGMNTFLIIRAILMIAGIICISFGVALYMKTDLGVAPYDMISQIVEDLTHGKILFKWARVVLDSISMAVGFISGGTFGTATFVVAFLTGPLVSWFREHAAVKLVGE